MATTNNNLRGYIHSRELLGNKYTSGRLLVDAGSDAYPGAAVLAVGGARRGGAGYINYRNRAQLPTQLVLHAYPDVVPLREVNPALFDAILVGPGSPEISELPEGRRVIIDGGALSLVDQIEIGRVSQDAAAEQLRILTPHEGELKNLGFDPSNREAAAIKAASETRSVLLLKGYRSIVATPSGISYIDEIGSVELSTAGTGDVLAGLISSMIAAHRPESLEEAAAITAHAVEICSKAAQLAIGKRFPLVATDLLDEIPRLLAQEGTSL